MVNFKYIQNDALMNGAKCVAEYDTFDGDSEAQNFKFGFICVEHWGRCYTRVAFDSAKDWADLMDEPESYYEDLEKMEVGDSKVISNEYTSFTYIRLW